MTTLHPALEILLNSNVDLDVQEADTLLIGKGDNDEWVIAPKNSAYLGITIRGICPDGTLPEVEYLQTSSQDLQGGVRYLEFVKTPIRAETFFNTFVSFEVHQTSATLEEGRAYEEVPAHEYFRQATGADKLARSLELLKRKES